MQPVLIPGTARTITDLQYKYFPLHRKIQQGAWREAVARRQVNCEDKLSGREGERAANARVHSEWHPPAMTAMKPLGGQLF